MISPFLFIWLGGSLTCMGVTWIGRYDSAWTMYAGALALGLGLGFYGVGITRQRR